MLIYLTKAPWAKRVHGVEGQRCCTQSMCKLSETDRFITVDGDNIITGFLATSIDIPRQRFRITV